MFVSGDDSGFDLAVAFDEVDEGVFLEGGDGLGVLFEGGEEAGVADNGVFDGFGESAAEFAGGEGFEGVGVSEDHFWLIE